jgi:hypothetical protein
MTLNARQSETLRDIRYRQMSGHRRAISLREAQELCNLGLVEKQPGIEPCYRLTPKGWKVLALAEERLSLLVPLYVSA